MSLQLWQRAEPEAVRLLHEKNLNSDSRHVHRTSLAFARARAACGTAWAGAGAMCASPKIVLFSLMHRRAALRLDRADLLATQDDMESSRQQPSRTRQLAIVLTILNSVLLLLFNTTRAHILRTPSTGAAIAWPAQPARQFNI